jgi:hypothetical protein
MKKPAALLLGAILVAVLTVIPLPAIAATITNLHPISGATTTTSCTGGSATGVIQNLGFVKTKWQVEFSGTATVVVKASLDGITYVAVSSNVTSSPALVSASDSWPYWCVQVTVCSSCNVSAKAVAFAEGF